MTTHAILPLPFELLPTANASTYVPDIKAHAVGQWVYWKRTDQLRGSDSYTPAVIIKLNGSQSAINYHSPYSANYWEVHTVTVSNKALIRRILPFELFRERMHVDVAGFSVAAMQHPIGATAQYPCGIWSGTVDGIGITGNFPCEQQAVHAAYNSLLDGSYAVVVQSRLQSYLQQMERESAKDRADNAFAHLAFVPQLEASLQKLAQNGFTAQLAHAA